MIERTKSFELYLATANETKSFQVSEQTHSGKRWISLDLNWRFAGGIFIEHHVIILF
jgi:hypothetical protein